MLENLLKLLYIFVKTKVHLINILILYFIPPFYYIKSFFFWVFFRLWGEEYISLCFLDFLFLIIGCYIAFPLFLVLLVDEGGSEDYQSQYRAQGFVRRGKRDQKAFKEKRNPKKDSQKRQP